MPVLTAAASELLRALFERAPQPLEPVVVGAHAIHLATDDPRAPLVSVVPSNGLRLPGGVVTAAPGAGQQWAELQAAAASGASLGAGGLRLGGLVVCPVRWWDGARPRASARLTRAGLAALRSAIERTAGPLDAVTGSAADGLEVAMAGMAATLRSAIERSAGPLDAVTGSAAERLEVAMAGMDPPGADGAPSPGGAGSSARVSAAAYAMVGLGPGLTPAGDDVLVGALLTLAHLERCDPWSGLSTVRKLRAALLAGTAEATPRTTTVSGALLSHAARGEGMPVLLDLLAATTTYRTVPSPQLVEGGWFGAVPGNHQPPIAGEEAGLRRAAGRVAAVGHDTGSAMLRGVHMAAGCALPGVHMGAGCAMGSPYTTAGYAAPAGRATIAW